jgi:hypothetical protein
MKSITASDAQFQENLSRIRQASIFFGHQSVGQNVLGGLQGLLDTSAPQLNIIRIQPGEEAPSGPCLAHATLGENDNPPSKIRAFGEFLDRSAAKAWDIALMKFCYLDITQETDVLSLFGKYRDKVKTLRKSHPHLTLMHVTVPLTYESRFRTLLKKFLGKPTTPAHNVKRQEYNTLLQEEFGEDPIFDLSRLESTHADGSRASFRKGSRTYFSLAPEYTEDGGHLNEIGSRVLAREWIRVLAEALSTRESRSDPGRGKQ